jgi:hypothetical protein
LTFVGLEWTPTFERAFNRYRFYPERAEAFRADLGESGLHLLDTSLAGHLQRYGYS